jgi:hypothetical protein
MVTATTPSYEQTLPCHRMPKVSPSGQHSISHAPRQHPRPSPTGESTAHEQSVSRLRCVCSPQVQVQLGWHRVVHAQAAMPLFSLAQVVGGWWGQRARRCIRKRPKGTNQFSLTVAFLCGVSLAQHPLHPPLAICLTVPWHHESVSTLGVRDACSKVRWVWRWGVCR